jgi:hypothetical protein
MLNGGRLSRPPQAQRNRAGKGVAMADEQTPSKEQLLSAERARELFHYDPETGLLTWKTRYSPFSRVRIGAVAGRMDHKGYRTVTIQSYEYFIHRVIWLMVTGEWPKFSVDHINGNRVDNRLANLRDIPHVMNMHNYHRANSGNKLSLLGVTQRPSGKFRAQIRKGENIHLGTFETAEAAHAAYVEAKRSMHEGNTL